VVGDDNKALSRRVRLGALQPNGLRVVEEGLKANEKIVVTGIQMVRQGEPVTPEEVAMPTSDSPAPAFPKAATEVKPEVTAPKSGAKTAPAAVPAVPGPTPPTPNKK
jgi:hypothetical protein